jgi:hypothetical protein
MRGTIHLVAILLAPLGLGCATTVDVVVDAREDFSQYRTWDWSSRARSNVDAPDGDAAALDARLARLIERRLLENGFERVGNRADFFVTYQLALRHRSVVVNQPRALYQLDSHHSSGSYLIEGSERVTRVYSVIHLAIGVTEARGRTLWRASLVQQVEDGFALKLNDAVASLLERFPRQRLRNDADERQRRRSICDDANPAREPPPGGGARDREGDSDRELHPDSRCPGGDIDSDRPEPDPLLRPPEPGSLA